jgi:hypothetical protein
LPRSNRYTRDAFAGADRRDAASSCQHPVIYIATTGCIDAHCTDRCDLAYDCHHPGHPGINTTHDSIDHCADRRFIFAC